MKRLRNAVMLVVLAGITACAQEMSAPVQSGALTISGGKTTATTDMSITAALPDSATQDTTLDVVISGSGFVAGTAAEWALAGIKDPLQVRTNGTRYVSSRQIVANITISAGAAIGKWDIVVSAAGKKGGIGTESFAIKPKPYIDVDSRANIVFSSVVNIAAPGSSEVIAPAGIQGDSRDKTGAPSTLSEYQGAFCRVNAKIFWASGPASSGDMVFDADMDYGNRTNCGARRALKMFLDYSPGGSVGTPTLVTSFSNVRAVMQMAPGEVISRKMAFNYTGLTSCDRLMFDKVVWPSSANVRVTRLEDGTTGRRWLVESEYPHRAMCTIPRGQDYYSKGVVKYLPFSFTISEIQYPYPSAP